MMFNLNVSRVQHLPGVDRKYDEELDDVRSILIEIGRALADSTAAEFTVSGFGQTRWPLDLGTDLPVFLEQLPAAISAVEAGTAFRLDFYEQGIERTIHFSPWGGLYSAKCESYTQWVPDPPAEQISRDHLQSMLVEIRDGLMRLLSRTLPSVANHPWMRTWAGTETPKS